MRQQPVGNPDRRPRRLLVAGLMAAAVAVAGGCGDAAGVSRITAPQFEPRLVSSNTPAGLLECPTHITQSTSGTIGPLGGSLTLDGTSLVLPPGAVGLPTPFTLAIPASNYMEVRITAGGMEHFEFLKPVSATISYARCTRADIDKVALTVWHIDPVTKALLENMNGSDDKSARTVSFGTDHLSGYSIGYGTEPPPEGEN